MGLNFSLLANSVIIFLLLFMSYTKEYILSLRILLLELDEHCTISGDSGKIRSITSDILMKNVRSDLLQFHIAEERLNYLLRFTSSKRIISFSM